MSKELQMQFLSTDKLTLLALHAEAKILADNKDEAVSVIKRDVQSIMLRKEKLLAEIADKYADDALITAYIDHISKEISSLTHELSRYAHAEESKSVRVVEREALTEEVSAKREVKSLTIHTDFDTKTVSLFKAVNNYVSGKSTFADRYGYNRLLTEDETYAVTKNGEKLFEVDKAEIRTTAVHVTEAIKFYKTQVAEGRYADNGMIIVLDDRLSDAEVKGVLEALVTENVKIESIKTLMKAGDGELIADCNVKKLFEKHGVAQATEASDEVEEEEVSLVNNRKAKL